MLQSRRLRESVLLALGVITPLGILAVNISAFVMTHLTQFRIGIAALAGGLVGSLLLLRTPESTFVMLIPWLLLFATLLFTFGTPLAKRLTGGKQAPLALGVVAQLAISVYGGYFGGGMGIMMLAVMTLLGMTHIHRMNALKNSLGALINGVAVVAFVVAGAVRWEPGVVMIAERAPSETISRTAPARSASSLNSCPTSSSASTTFGETTSGSARTARRSASPSVSTIVITSSLCTARTICA